jgi:hypothetical protein
MKSLKVKLLIASNNINVYNRSMKGQEGGQLVDQDGKAEPTKTSAECKVGGHGETDRHLFVSRLNGTTEEEAHNVIALIAKQCIR